MNNNSMMMPPMSLKQAKYIALMIYEAGSIPHLTGKSGVGKTSMCLELASLLGAEFDPALNVSNFSGCSPVEASGYGVPGPWNTDEDADIDLRFSVSRGIPTFAKYGFSKVLWVWDEMTNWPTEIIAMTRGCVTPVGFPKKWGEHTIAPNVYIVITSNRRGDGSRQSVVLDAPSVARATTLVIEPDMRDTLDHFVSIGLSDSDHFNWLVYLYEGIKDGGNGLAEANKYFAPDPAQPWDGQPYPCPRQHEVACRATRPDSLLMQDGTHSNKVMMLSGLLGPDAGAQSAAWSDTLKESVGTAKKVLSGAQAMPTGKAAAYSVAMAAYRMVKKPLSGLTVDLKCAAVKGGDVDNFVDLVLMTAPREMAKWIFEMGIRKDETGNCALPLDMHPLASTLQGV